MTPERELELLKQDHDALNDTIQSKVDSSVNMIVSLFEDNKLTPCQAYEAMAGVFYALNGLDKSNYLANLLQAMGAERVGVGADVAVAGDHLVMREQGSNQIKVVKVLKTLEMPSGAEDSQAYFRQVINHLRTKAAQNAG